MATYNLNTTASVDLLSSDISASQETTFSIANPLSNSSYFTFETIRNSDGFYDSSSPKNMAGTYSLGAGLSGVVKSDYIASVIVKPGGGDLTFTPDNYISGSSLNLRGTSSPPAPTGTSFDADAQAFFTRVADAGGSLSTTEQTAVNNLVVQMKADGIWTKMKAIYPMVGASAAACAQNLKSSSFTGAFTSGWTFSSTGVTPNGTSAYMDTGLNASTQLSTPSHLSKYTGTNDNTGSDEIDMGIRDFWLSLWYKAPGFDNLLARNQSNSVLLDGGIVTDSRGFGLNTKISNTAKIFFNNVQKDSKTDTTTTYTNNNVYLGSWNNSGAGLYSKRDFRFASIGDGLTDTEASDLYTAVQAFQTTLSRNV